MLNLISAPLFSLFATAAPQTTFRELDQPAPITVSGFPSESFVFDFDLDGDSDVVLTNDGFRGVATLLECLGDGTFRERDAPFIAPSIADLVAGDVDADGDLDVFMTRAGPVRFFRNRGGLDFADESDQLPPTAFCRSLALGDVDGDGTLDLFCGQDRTPNALLLNDGTGSFSEASGALPAADDCAPEAEFGDFDGDGRLDLYVTGSDCGRSDAIYFNRDGQFHEKVVVELFTSTRDVRLADADGDGLVDVFRSRATALRPGIDLFLNEGAGSFTRRNLWTTPYVTWMDFEILDADGDGDVDYIRLVDGPPSLFLNTGTGEFVESSFPNSVRGRKREISVGDFDVDGDADVLLSDLVVDVMLGNGTGRFLNTSDTGLPFFDTDHRGSRQIVDVDGDGDLDVVHGHFSLVVSRNQGLYRFTREPQDSVGVPGTFELGDLDQDGFPDLVTAYFRVAVYFNDGTGNFHSPAPLGRISVDVVDLVDLDGDGDLDIATFDASQHSVVILWNEGSRAFRAQEVSGIAVSRSRALVGGDLDGDGDGDLVLLGDSESDPPAVLVNEDGAFVDRPSLLPLREFASYYSALEDLDGDEDLDLVVVGTTSPYDVLALFFFNDGKGGFGPPREHDVSYRTSIHCFDADLDGDMDVLIGPDLFFNDGTTRFPRATRLPILSTSFALQCVGDLDQDGDEDVLSSIYRVNQLMVNQTRQVERRSYPLLGRENAIRISGPPGGRALVMASTRSRSIRTGLGIKWIDPAGLTLVEPLRLDEEGKAELPLYLPDDPSLDGQQLFVQASMGPPFRYSNAFSMTLTRLEPELGALLAPRSAADEPYAAEHHDAADPGQPAQLLVEQQHRRD